MVLAVCILGGVDGQAADDLTHRLVSLARLGDCTFLVHDRNVTILAILLTFNLFCVTPLLQVDSVLIALDWLLL